MKKTIKLLIALFGIFFVMVGCTEKEEMASLGHNDAKGNIPLTFSAYPKEEDGGTTRTCIDAGNSKQINWGYRNQISIFDGSSQNCPFELTEGAGTKNGKFEGNVSSVASSYVALYPYNSSVTFLDGTINGVKLRDKQSPQKGSFDSRAALMVARSKGSSLPFKNVVGYIKFTCKTSFASASFTSKSGAVPLAGSINVSVDAQGNPSVTPIEPSYTVELSSTSANLELGGVYYIALLPCTMKGFTLTLTASNGTKYYRFSDKTLTITSGKVVNLGEMSKDVYDIPYVTFSADAPQTFWMTAANDENEATLPYYSVGGKEWSSQRLEKGKAIEFGGEKGDLRLRGDCKYGTVTITDTDDLNTIQKKAYRIVFGKSAVKVRCTGDIRTLIDWTNYRVVSTSEARFAYLFYNCTELTSAPDLPSNNIASWCYCSMFRGCTNLQKIQGLPSRKLQSNCYNRMFYGCSSLAYDSRSNKLVLPAERLAIGCYSEMFRKTTKIKYIELHGHVICFKNEEGRTVSRDLQETANVTTKNIKDSKSFYNWLGNASTSGLIWFYNPKTRTYLVSSGVRPDGWSSTCINE